VLAALGANIDSKIDRLVMILETIFLLMPTTYFVLWAGFMLTLYVADQFPAGAFLLALYLSAVVALVAGWYLILKFLSAGSAGIRAIGILPYLLAGFGAVLAILPLLLSAMGMNIGQFNVFAIGLPAVVPFIHILSRRFGTRGT
jgi:hypothetical protein